MTLDEFFAHNGYGCGRGGGDSWDDGHGYGEGCGWPIVEGAQVFSCACGNGSGASDGAGTGHGYGCSSGISDGTSKEGRDKENGLGINP